MISIFEKLTNLLFPETPPPEPLSDKLCKFMQETVSFYAELNTPDKLRFEQRCLSFIHNTEFIGHNIEIKEEDKLLIAAGSVILIQIVVLFENMVALTMLNFLLLSASIFLSNQRY